MRRVSDPFPLVCSLSAIDDLREANLLHGLRLATQARSDVVVKPLDASTYVRALMPVGAAQDFQPTMSYQVSERCGTCFGDVIAPDFHSVLSSGMRFVGQMSADRLRTPIDRVLFPGSSGERRAEHLVSV